MNPIEEIRASVENSRCRSYWERGVQKYALELLDKYAAFPRKFPFEQPATWEEFEKLLLRGAKNWSDYSWSGRALCKESEVKRRLLTPTEKKEKNYGGRLHLSKGETYLDVQARALEHAAGLIEKHCSLTKYPKGPMYSYYWTSAANARNARKEYA